MNNKSKIRRGNSERLVMAVLFPVLSLLSLLFVFWIGFASFESNCYEISRQLYKTILSQSVSDIESAIRNGKTIDSFYGIDRVLLQTTNYINEDAHAAVTGPSGGLYYATFDLEDETYTGLLNSEQVRLQMSLGAEDGEVIAIESGNLELLVQPIYGRDGSLNGNLCLIYPAKNPELLAEQNSELLNMTLIVAGCVMVLTLAWVFFRRKNDASQNGRLARRAADGKLLAAVPTLMLTAGILIQSGTSFFTYQAQYKEMMLRSAETTCMYMGSLVSQAHDKGVPYDRMHGLDEFFADKLQQMPGLWDIRLVRVMANSQDILTRDNDFQISVPISGGGEDLNIRLDVTISQQYIDQKMTETLLLSFITLIVSAVAVIEITKLPELITLRMSRDFGKPEPRQRAGIQIGLRLCAFLMYTGVYVVVPFSSMLVRQWRITMLGLPLDVTAGIPMTVEMFSLMIGGLTSAAIFRRMNIRAGLGASGILFIAANILCLFIANPYQLAALRFLSGIAFSGILYTSNYIISYGANEGDARSSALAGVNSGLLGGIMAGGALGAVIASTMGIAQCFIAAAGLCAVAGIMLFTLVPWRMLAINQNETRADAEKTRGRAQSLRALFHGRTLLHFVIVMIPVSLGLMFIVAGMPAFAQANGLSPLVLSCGYLANGVAGIYLGGPLLRVFTRRFSGNVLMAATLITGGVAVGIIFLPPMWLMLLLCAFLLGLFDGVGTPTTMLLFLELPGIRKLRPVDALVVESTIMRAVNTAAPVAYGLIIAAAVGGAGVFAVLGGAFVAAGAVHLVVSKAFKEKELITK